MGPNRFERIEELFHAARKLANDQRVAFVEREADDTELATSVLRLLRYEDAANVTSVLAEPDELDASCVDGTEDDPLLGRQIGSYRIIATLGKGGFGTVYSAAQTTPLRREVALKVLRIGSESDQVVARFEAERQALAIMDHPGIARVFDAGRTDQSLGSRSFFAMELVRGTSVVAFCDEHHLSTRDRLSLFIMICRAVQHAHQKGVIHRDLKPSNILVEMIDGVPSPKIIDFGIAKALQEPLTNQTLVTEARQLLGTPRYMSPEQADLDSAAVDTRSDIYALGVTLYEMLTGVTPLDEETVRRASVSSLQRMIAETVTIRPSTRLSHLAAEAREIARARGTEPAALKRAIAGDLDWIVMKALEKDRDRRYQSASEFADDIERSLAGHAVLAGPPSITYQFRKLVRRHRISLAALTLVLLALSVGVGGILVGAVRARREADRGAAVYEFMREVLTSTDSDRGGADVRLVDVLEHASSTVATRFADHPIQLATVRDLLGEIYTGLGFLTQATEQYRLALDILRVEVGADDDRTVQAQLSVLSSLLNLSKRREAEEVIADLLPRLSRLRGPNDPDVLACQSQLAMTHRLAGRFDEAEEIARTTLTRARQIRPDRPDLIARFRGELLAILTARGRLLNGEGTESERRVILDEALTLATLQVDEMSELYGPHSRRALYARRQQGVLLVARGDFPEAVVVCRSLLEDTSGRLHDCHSTRADAMGTLARALAGLGAYGEAADLFIRRVDCIRDTVSPNSLVLLAALSDAVMYLNLGERWEVGESNARRLVEGFSERLGPTHGYTIGYETYLARFVSKQGRSDEAETIFASLLARQEAIDSSDRAARLMLFHGAHLTSVGAYEEAERSILRAAEITGAPEHGTWNAHPDDILIELIALYERWGRPNDAQQYRSLLSRNRAGRADDAGTIAP